MFTIYLIYAKHIWLGTSENTRRQVFALTDLSIDIVGEKNKI